MNTSHKVISYLSTENAIVPHAYCVITVQKTLFLTMDNRRFS